jgi:integrase
VRRSVLSEASAVHRPSSQEFRLATGQGKAPEDALVFGEDDGSPRSPNAVTKKWGKAMKDAGIDATLHSLRHTHASLGCPI